MHLDKAEHLNLRFWKNCI